MGVLDVKFMIYIRIWFWKPGSRKVDIQELVENRSLKMNMTNVGRQVKKPQEIELRNLK